MSLIYKILPSDAWDRAKVEGVFHGSAVDRADGFIHFSDALQIKETAARHFAGQGGLLLVAFDAADFGDTLKWEASRGGALFPHLYGALDPQLERSSLNLPWDGERHMFPKDFG